MRWFAHQPYAVPELFPNARFSAPIIEAGCLNLLRLALEIGLLLLPLLVAFYPALAASRGRLAAASVLAFALSTSAWIAHRVIHHLGQFLVPTLLDGGNYVGVQGVLTAWPEHGSRPMLIPDQLRLCLTIAVFLGFLAVIVATTNSPPSAAIESPATGLAWKTVLALTVPFSLAYLALLTPRAAFFHPYDRYSLPLLVVSVLLLTLLYQRHMANWIPAAPAGMMVFIGAYSIAATHDAFAMYRGTQTAIQEVLASGVPATGIDGGWDYDGWTQVTQGQFVHDLRLGLKEDQAGPERPDTRVCHFELQRLFPVVHPVYALAFEPILCGGPTSFPPIEFHTWLPLRAQKIYVVRDAPQVH